MAGLVQVLYNLRDAAFAYLAFTDSTPNIFLTLTLLAGPTLVFCTKNWAVSASSATSSQNVYPDTDLPGLMIYERWDFAPF